MKSKYPYWETSEDERCPHCGNLVKFEISFNKKRGEHISEERCMSCDWSVSFDILNKIDGKKAPV
jgi:hypothetical protein